MVIFCQYNRDAERIKIALCKPLAKYGLKMNDDKTKLVKFSKRQQRQEIKQETFDFLGFTKIAAFTEYCADESFNRDRI